MAGRKRWSWGGPVPTVDGGAARRAQAAAASAASVSQVGPGGSGVADQPADQPVRLADRVALLHIAPERSFLRVRGEGEVSEDWTLSIARVLLYARAGLITLVLSDGDRVPLRLLGTAESRGLEVGDRPRTLLTGTHRGLSGVLLAVPRVLLVVVVSPYFFLRAVRTSRERSDALAATRARLAGAFPDSTEMTL